MSTVECIPPDKYPSMAFVRAQYNRGGDSGFIHNPLPHPFLWHDPDSGCAESSSQQKEKKIAPGGWAGWNSMRTIEQDQKRRVSNA